jgi:hypothetical protein
MIETEIPVVPGHMLSLRLSFLMCEMGTWPPTDKIRREEQGGCGSMHRGRRYEVEDEYTLSEMLQNLKL